MYHIYIILYIYVSYIYVSYIYILYYIILYHIILYICVISYTEPASFEIFQMEDGDGLKTRPKAPFRVHSSNHHKLNWLKPAAPLIARILAPWVVLRPDVAVATHLPNPILANPIQSTLTRMQIHVIQCHTLCTIWLFNIAMENLHL